MSEQRTSPKRKVPSRTTSEQKEAKKLKPLFDEEIERTTVPKPPKWTPVSVKHRDKFERLLEVWESDPASITMVNGNGVCFKKEFVIGSGSRSEMFICLGTDLGTERAVKRLPRLPFEELVENETIILRSPNIIKSRRIVNYCFYDNLSSPDFVYLILNLYEQDLQEFFEGKEKSWMTESRGRKMMRQLLEGLEALHAGDPGILHKNLQPSNVLMDVWDNLMLSDFGKGCFFPEQGATTSHITNKRVGGSFGWVAPEGMDWSEWLSDDMQATPLDGSSGLTEKSDIYVAGILSCYILTTGRNHPFGPKISQIHNLCHNNPVGLSHLNNPVAKDLLSQMLAREQDKRPYVEQALKHPFFLSLEEQMKFVAAVGNQCNLVSHNGVTKQLNNLDPHKPRRLLLTDNWIDVIGHVDLKTLCEGGKKSPSEYNGSLYTHLLRLIRNAFEHRDGKLRRLKSKKPATSCLEEYFFELFPTLPLVLHQIIREDPNWKTRPALKEFFPVINRRAVSGAD